MQQISRAGNHFIPFAIVWSGWGLVTAALAVLGYVISAALRWEYGILIGFATAAALNFGFVAILDNMTIVRNGTTITRAQESTLFGMPLHRWSYIFVAFAVVLRLYTWAFGCINDGAFFARMMPCTI